MFCEAAAAFFFSLHMQVKQQGLNFDAPWAEAHGVFILVGFRRKPNTEKNEMGALLSNLKVGASAHPWSVSDSMFEKYGGVKVLGVYYKKPIQ